jgi:surface protein
MFQSATAFNQPLSGFVINWDVSNVTNMSLMFSGATAFNQPLENWNVSKVANFVGFMADKTPATFDHLDGIYYGWSLLTFVNTGLNISFGTVKYNMLTELYRNVLTNPPNNWTITDGGLI